MLWNMGFVMKKTEILITFVLIILFSFFGVKKFASADTTSSPASGTCTTTVQVCLDNNIQSCDACVNYLNNQISEKQGQEKTLSSQISVMDNQIKLTEYRIEATQEQITSLTMDIDTATKKVSGLQAALNNLVGVLANRIVATYEVGTIQPFQILLTSDNASDFFKRLNYLKIAQAHDKQLIYDTQQAKVDYANQKNIFEEQKKKVEALKVQLQAYTDQLNNEKGAKKRLLADTQGSEATYQSLLSQAKAQLAGFSSFVNNQGGASILTNQTVCDDWGCYYNQRDSQWGNVALNNTQYSIASDGCLLTAMAMVYTHFGHKSVNPLTINSNSSNFASYYPAYLNRTIVADGATSTRVPSAIDGELKSGHPVIVGIRYSNGDTHFVVLVDYNGGNYLMNDPFTPNGHKIPFADKYSLNSIYEIDAIQGL